VRDIRASRVRAHALHAPVPVRGYAAGAMATCACAPTRSDAPVRASCEAWRAAIACAVHVGAWVMKACAIGQVLWHWD
jgi:hypothetical protein